MGSTSRWLIAAVTFVLGASAALFALHANHPPTTSIASGHETYSYISGMAFVASVSSSELAASPTWVAGNSLPLRPEDAIARAQEAMKTLGSEVASSSFSELALSEEQPDEGQPGGFFYTVTFHPNGPLRNGDAVRLLVYFNGKITLPVALNRSAP